MSMSSNWTTIGIRLERLNGLKLLAGRDGRRTPGNMLDIILERSGVEELSEEELQKKLRKLSKEVTAS